MIYAKNKKAYYNYEILDEVEAGLVLQGHEVKSVRNGQAKLKGAFVTFKGNEAYVTNMHISPYKYAGDLEDYNPTRPRKLLLKKKQINYLRGKSQEKGLTIVPLSVYNKGRFIKVKIGVGKGRKKYDKREKIKKRDRDRDIQRQLKNFNG